MTTAKKSMMMLLRLALLYIISACISAFAPDVFLLRNSATVFLMAVSLSLTIYFSDHIIERSMRKYLVGIAGLITLWSVLRGAKYISFEETGVIARHIWYLYYIPALLHRLRHSSQTSPKPGETAPLSGASENTGVTVTL